MSITDIPRIPDPAEKPACDRGTINHVMPLHMSEFGQWLQDGDSMTARHAANALTEDARTLAVLLSCVTDSEDVDRLGPDRIHRTAWMITSLLETAVALREEGEK